MARTPDLSSNGLGRSLNHEPDAHQCARGVLASSEGERQVRRALAWIAPSGVRPVPVARQRSSSYDLKHRVEVWHHPRRAGNVYVSNGALIAAALLTGLEVVPIEGSPNAWVGLARASELPSPWAA